MQIDAHRTYFRTVPAKGRSVTQMFKIIHSPQMGRVHRSARAGISSFISMTTDILIYRTSIQTSTATDAIQTLARLCIGQNIRTSVIKQDDIHVFRSIGFTGLTRTTEYSIVNGDLLPCPIGSQQWPE